jgi:hypothetical protein
MKTLEQKKERVKKNVQRWRLKNPEKVKEQRKRAYQKLKNDPVRYAEKLRKHYIYKNKPERKEIEEKYRLESIKKWFKKQWNTNTEFRIKSTCRSRIRQAVKKGFRSGKTLDLLGVKDIQIVIQHLQKQFKKGMSWDNHGDWHIDHIIPCASFDLTKPSEQKKCFHYTNLQPLWARENLKKGARLEWRKS